MLLLKWIFGQEATKMSFKEEKPIYKKYQEAGVLLMSD